jgi:NADPH2:quinone reductase
VAFKAAIANNLEKNIWPLILSGDIKPIVYKIFPAEKAANAHRLMESSGHTGKMVLSWC